MSEAKALAACRAYDHWAHEIKRLTSEIGAVECPREGEPSPFATFPSHFRQAADVRVGMGDRLTLDEIRKRVADCPECSRLCVLIAERREARKRFGVAKRAVRRAGRTARVQP